MRASLLLLLACTPKVALGPTLVDKLEAPIPVTELRDEQALGLYLQVMVHAGSAFDRVGKEGLAALTARAMLRGGAGDLDPQALDAALYQNGIDLDLVVDREWVSLRMRCHPEVSRACVDLFEQLLIAPRFDSAVVAREVQQARYRLEEGATEDIEVLGEQVLETWLYEGHPYGHPVDGRSGVLELLDPADARDFHRRHYVRAAMHAGIAGQYDDEIRTRFVESLARVPSSASPMPDATLDALALPSAPPELVLQAPPTLTGRHLLTVEGPGDATGFHFGHPITITRDHEDWPALYLALTWLGAHRQSHGRLFQSLRESRGLNYGTYAYVEPYRQRGWSAMPEQGVLLQQPYFYVWVRPVAVTNGPFALKLAIDELERLVEQGLTQDQLDATRDYLSRRQPIEAATVDRRLAYALEGTAAGVPDPNQTLAERLSVLDVEGVRAALARHLRPNDLRIVAVTSQPDELIRQLVEESSTPIVYASVQPSEDQAAVDERVGDKHLGLTSTHVVSSQGIFR